MKYSLGPVLYYWSKETLEDFYQQAPPVMLTLSILASVVRNLNAAKRLGDWLDMAKSLAGSGKQVVRMLALVRLLWRAELTLCRKRRLPVGSQRSRRGEYVRRA